MKKFLVWIGRLIKWGCIAFTAGCVLGLVGLAILIGNLGIHKAAIKDHSILVLNLDEGITDRPAGDGAGGLLRGLLDEEQTISLRAVTQSVREAARDKRISGLYVRGSINPSGYESGLAALKEVREALMEFRKSGKPIVAYLAEPNQRDLYLVSVAEEIWLNPSGVVELPGLAASGTFFKGAGDKYGVQFQPTRHGKYKSAVEPYLRGDYSQESREQLGALLQNAWGEITRGIAESRKLKPETLQAIAEKQIFLRAPQAKAAGLVTGTAYEGEVLEKLRAMTRLKGKAGAIPHVTMADYSREAGELAEKKSVAKDKIAVIYAEGEIIDGVERSMGDGQIAGGTFARMLREIGEDQQVKAVVLRVNSPGGSATASDVILDELRRLQKTRPVMVSMGTVAASGGYLIATAADRIFAEPTTITGSIGVFGMGINIQKLANEHGLTFDSIKTTPHADIGTLTRPMNEFEQLKIQELVDGVYADFITAVANCRKMTTNQVDGIAQGRVWSGTDALKQGLVDELGGLDAAIAEAARRAKLGKFTVVEYPEAKEFVAELFGRLDKKNDPLARLGLAGGASGELRAQLSLLNQFRSRPAVYARMPFNLVIR